MQDASDLARRPLRVEFRCVSESRGRGRDDGFQERIGFCDSCEVGLPEERSDGDFRVRPMNEAMRHLDEVDRGEEARGETILQLCKGRLMEIRK